MIDVCNSWEDSDLKEGLKFTIANHMKKSFLNWNKDTVEDDVIFEHLFELSDGKINLAKWDEDLSDSDDLMRGKSKHTGKTNQKNRNNNGKNNRNKKRY